MSRSASEAWAAATDFEYNDAAVIRWADDYAEALLLAVDAVRELHRAGYIYPVNAWGTVDFDVDPIGTYCLECVSDEVQGWIEDGKWDDSEDTPAWPCPTWRLTKGL